MINNDIMKLSITDTKDEVLIDSMVKCTNHKYHKKKELT